MASKKCSGLLVLALVFGMAVVGCIPEYPNNKDPVYVNTPTFDAPQHIRLERSYSSVTLYWSSISTAYSYEIYYGLSPYDLSFYIERTSYNSYSFNSLDTGKIYYFAVKAKYSTGTSDFSQIVNCFTLPSSTSTIYEQGKYASTSSSYFHDCSGDRTYWFKIPVLADKTATFYISSDRYSSSYSLATISSQTYYTEDGIVIPASYKSPKDQYLYAKVATVGYGQIKAYYSIE